MVSNAHRSGSTFSDPPESFTAFYEFQLESHTLEICNSAGLPSRKSIQRGVGVQPVARVPVARMQDYPPAAMDRATDVMVGPPVHPPLEFVLLKQAVTVLESSANSQPEPSGRPAPAYPPCTDIDL